MLCHTQNTKTTSPKRCGVEAGHVVTKAEFPYTSASCRPKSKPGLCSSPTQLDEFLLWSYNVWEEPHDEVFIEYVVQIFESFDLLETLDISRSTMLGFVADVRSKYHNNPYHNFRHAFDVIQALVVFLTVGKASTMFTKLELFSLLLAALIHDIDHDGQTNTYHVTIGSELALLHNDRSVLESHHCYVGFKTVNAWGLLRHLPPQQYREVRKMTLDLIFATDLTYHVDITTKYKAILDESFDSTNMKHRFALMEILLKCADSGNPARPWPIARYWASLIHEEFYAEGEKLKSLGYPVAAWMERKNMHMTPDTQLRFISFAVDSSYSLLVHTLPELAFILPIIETNRQHWECIKRDIVPKIDK